MGVDRKGACIEGVLDELSRNQSLELSRTKRAVMAALDDVRCAGARHSDLFGCLGVWSSITTTQLALTKTCTSLSESS